MGAKVNGNAKVARGFLRIRHFQYLNCKPPHKYVLRLYCYLLKISVHQCKKAMISDTIPNLEYEVRNNLDHSSALGPGVS